MTHDVSIRPATEADAAAVLALRAAIFAETAFMLWEPAEFKDSVADEAARIRRLSGGRNSAFFVAAAEDRLVGFCAAMGGAANRQCHCATLALGVLREHWGKGIGSLLLGRVDEWAQAACVTRLELTVHTTNLRAVALYMRAGFQVEGVRRNSLFVDGSYVDEYLMSKLRDAA